MCFNFYATNYVFVASDGNKVDGVWGSWGEWESCSATCGGGTRRQKRSCDNPLPENGGKSCTDDGSTDEKSESCNSGACPGMRKFYVWACNPSY